MAPAPNAEVNIDSSLMVFGFQVALQTRLCWRLNKSGVRLFPQILFKEVPAKLRYRVFVTDHVAIHV
eukprot:1336956-Amphidinium_carterae.1